MNRPTQRRKCTFAILVCHAVSGRSSSTDSIGRPGFIHSVLLTNLQPATIYYYQYGNDADGWSVERSFVSRPSADVASVKFLAYADMGWGGDNSARSTSLHALQEIVNGYDHGFLLHFGDISALYGC